MHHSSHARNAHPAHPQRAPTNLSPQSGRQQRAQSNPVPEAQHTNDNARLVNSSTGRKPAS